MPVGVVSNVNLGS